MKKEMTLEEIKRIKEEDKVRFNALYADEDGIVDEEFYEEELKRGKKYHLHWDGHESVLFNDFKSAEEAFYNTDKDGIVFKMDGFQAGQIILSREKGKVWSVFD